MNVRNDRPAIIGKTLALRFAVFIGVGVMIHAPLHETSGGILFLRWRRAREVPCYIFCYPVALRITAQRVAR